LLAKLQTIFAQLSLNIRQTMYNQRGKGVLEANNFLIGKEKCLSFVL